MAVNLTPLHDRVIVKRIEEKETVKGGIIIPDTAKEKPQEGEVIAVGAGKREKGELIPLDVKGGDRKAVRRADHHHGRRDGCKGNRTEGSPGENGCPDGARSRFQDV